MADPKDPKNPIETPALEAASKLTDKERQELDELRADKKVASIAEAARQKQERDAVFEKHSKRLSPATMAALRGDLEKLEAAKIDAYLSRLSDEVHPTPTGTSAAPAGDPAKAKKEDPEGELLERATKLRKENPELRLDQRGAINRIKRDDPELAARVQKQRESYKIPILSPEA